MPVPLLVRLVRFPVLFTTAPAISPKPLPLRASVLLPPAVAVKSLVNLSKPVPFWVIVAVRLLPAPRLMVLFDVAAEPV